jgi:hypothetical protein
MINVEGHPDEQVRAKAFLDGLAEPGWSEGRDIQTD